MQSNKNVLVLLCILFMFPLLLIGCGTGQQAGPTEGLEKTLQAYQNRAYESATIFTEGDYEFNMDLFKKELEKGFNPENNFLVEEFSDRFMEQIGAFTYTVGAEHIQGDTAFVQVEITYQNMVIPLGNALQRLDPGAQNAPTNRLGTVRTERLLLEELLKELNASEERRTETLEIRMIQLDGTWQVDPDNNDSLLNALTGNLSSL